MRGAAADMAAATQLASHTVAASSTAHLMHGNLAKVEAVAVVTMAAAAAIATFLP